jgi:hypothetical protein
LLLRLRERRKDRVFGVNMIQGSKCSKVPAVGTSGTLNLGTQPLELLERWNRGTL